MRHFDVAIIGAGVAGAIATYKFSKDFPKLNTITFDYGRPPMKRRRQLEGWLGCLPNSDGKLYSSDVKDISLISGMEQSDEAYKETLSLFSNIVSLKEIVDQLPSKEIQDLWTTNGYEIRSHSYRQIIPKDIHALSKFMAEKIENNPKTEYSFDNEVTKISHSKNKFVIKSENETLSARKILFCPGRAGWRFSHQVFKDLKLIQDNDFAKIGIKVEMNEDWFEEYNQSTCSFHKPGLDIGNLSWHGTVVPEDHNLAAISAFRANEPRWKSNKVMFDIIGHVNLPKQGMEQTDRLANLLFILTNERIAKEKISSILSGRSKLSILKEFGFLKPAIQELSKIIPQLTTKAYFHYPTVLALPAKIEVSSSFETKIPGFFVVGEAANQIGLLSAALSSMIAVNKIGA